MIKLFEDFTGYKKISTYDFDLYVFGDDDDTLFTFNNWIDFTKKEYNTLNSLYKKTNLQANKAIINIGNIHIYKLKDEWYYLEKGKIKYKCDQWDGLLNCLNDIFKPIK